MRRHTPLLDKTVRDFWRLAQRLSLAFLIKHPYNLRVYPKYSRQAEASKRGKQPWITLLTTVKTITDMSQPFKLFRLQQLDSHLDQTQARLAQIEAALSDDRELSLARTQAQEAENLVGSERKALRRAEEEVKSQRLKIEQTEATLYGGKVRNPKELQDLQQETAALKRFISVLEDRQLERMIALEDAEKVRTTALDQLEGTQQRNLQSNSALLKEQTSLLDEAHHLQAEREAEIASIPETDLALYQQLRQQRRGVAVARVTDKTCSACGSTLSAALLHAARSPNQLTRCDTCGRILYVG